MALMMTFAEFSRETTKQYYGGSGQIQKKRGRGYDKPKWGKSGKESIAFTEDGLCVDPKDAQLSRYLGSLAKNSRFLPLKPIDWRLHDDTTMDHVWKTIYDTIDWRPEDVPNIPKIRLVMLQRLSDRCRNYKASLKAKYYTPYVGLPERFLCGDDRVDRDQWRAMVNYWDTDPKNKEKKHGRKPDPIEMFYIVHKRRDENKSWIDDASEELAVKISRELTSLVETHGEETSELRQQAYVAARGLETRGRVRGYGRGVTPDMIPWVAQTQPTSSSLRSRTGRAYANLQSQYSELEEKYERQQKELDELKQMITSGNAHPHQQSSSQQQSNSQQEFFFQVKISRELTSLVETHGEETSELMQQAYVAASSFAISFPTTLTFPAHSDIVPMSSISASSTVSVYIIFAVLLPPSIPATFVPPSATPTWRVYSNAQ
ncbi:uncharacterized protein A4U43_C01F35320 [Asparagus officinalis]|uniref:Transposase Tnp1/En/Spm-like domain-containing protein n=1 Tax=Asparagus officinalis TaxID=4686 RepID=A0A5P1FXT5_ASPOF|nr:uncharacterized protein A4U43_C01F35320 [Asparagus officinalis]